MLRWCCTCTKKLVIFRNEQPAFPLEPALFHSVQVWRILRKIHDLDVFVLANKFPDES